MPASIFTSTVISWVNSGIDLSISRTTQDDSELCHAFGTKFAFEPTTLVAKLGTALIVALNYQLLVGHLLLS